MKRDSRHRPVWQPAKLASLINSGRGALGHVTFTRLLLAVIVLPVLFFVYREVTRSALIIDAFTVPKRFDESGLSSEVVAKRIGNALRQIETAAKTRMKRDNLTLLHDDGSMPDVEIPGTKLGLKTVIEITRAIFGIYPKHVNGDIVVSVPKNTETPLSKTTATVTIYITQGRKQSPAVSLVVTTDDIDLLAHSTAEMILGQVNPFLLAVYRYDHREFETAFQIAQRIIQDGSEDRSYIAAAYNLGGNVLSVQKKYDEAIAKYQKAIDLDPTFALAYCNLAVALKAQKKYDEAIAKYQRAIHLDPTLAVAYGNWGILLFEQKKYDEAIAKYQKAIDLDPTFALTYGNLAVALKAQKKYDEAIAKYQKAIDLDPTFAVAYRNWGILLFEQKKYDEAIAKYQKAIDLDPKYALAYVNLGLVLKEQKKYDEAIAKYQKAIDLDPTFALAYYNWGIALKEQKKYDEAIANYQKAIDLDPKYALAYSAWGIVLGEQQKSAESQAKLSKARELLSTQ